MASSTNFVPIRDSSCSCARLGWCRSCPSLPKQIKQRRTARKMNVTANRVINVIAAETRRATIGNLRSSFTRMANRSICPAPNNSMSRASKVEIPLLLDSRTGFVPMHLPRQCSVGSKAKFHSGSGWPRPMCVICVNESSVHFVGF